MFDLLSRIFATPKSIKKTIDVVAATGDKLVFTDEEKSDVQERLRTWYIKYLEATNPQNLSRRFIAVIVTLLWAFLIMLGVALAMITGDTSAVSIIVSADAKMEGVVTPAAFIFLVLRDIVNQPFSIIVGFYFLAQIGRLVTNGMNKGDK